MKFHLAIPLLVLATVFWCSNGGAASIDLSLEHKDAIGTYIDFLQEDKKALSPDQALDAYEAGLFQKSNRSILNFGIGTQPVWLQFDAVNTGQTPLKRQISLETSWLDKIEVYFLHNGQLLNSQYMGDNLPFAARPIENRYFVLEHLFPSGSTTVLLRVNSLDPKVLPVYLSTADQTQERKSFEAYIYSFVYGFISALLLYNLMLFLSLKDSRYPYYSLYLASFILTNMAYTGHAYQWLWPQYTAWQIFAPPVMMVVFASCGLLFATRFLGTRQNFPLIHRVLIWGLSLIALAMATSIVLGEQTAWLLIAFSMILVFSCTMVLLGIISVHAGIKYAKYFIIASISAVIGASITALTVWGLIPYSKLGYHAAEIGMLIDASLLALALADQYRVIQEEKQHAEQLAKIDHLTGMNNRRAFYDLVTPNWYTGLRNDRNMSVIVLDIDRFKNINDSHGHALGDQVLIQTAKTIAKSERRGDISARWGGEEFIIFLPETHLNDAVSAAERLRKKISRINLQHKGEKVSFTASFGVAHRDLKDIGLDELISIADAQLYLAKELGRNRVCALPAE